MPIDVLMPKLSPTMTEGRLASWTVNEGDEVSMGDIIAEVETDKATMEVEATEDGKIHKIIGEVGNMISVGVPIAVLAEDGEEVPADYTPVAAAPAEEKAPAPASAPTTVEAPKAAPAPAPVAVQPVAVPAPVVAPSAPTAAKGKVTASPLAKRLAEWYNLPLEQIPGSGPNGRIIKKDVMDVKENGLPQTATAGGSFGLSYTPTQPKAQVREELSMMRRTIAQRLTESKQTVPHFYLTADVRMDKLLEMRQEINAAANGTYKLTVNDFIIKACALALRDNPTANASWQGDHLLHLGDVDMAVAVAIDGGLITPILRQADQKPLPVLSTEMKQLAAKAKEGKLQPHEYQGGGFSISNLGMYGVKEFKAIVNPPQACILAVGASEEKVVVENGEMKVASVMTVSLSVDHRVVDGALGAEVLASIKEYLESPIKMVL